MTKTLLVSTVLALVSALPAQAAPQPIFQIEKNDAKALQPRRTATLFDDGSWTYDEVPAEGGATVHRSGMLSAATLKSVRAELAITKWKHEPLTGARCHMISSAYTSYRANGVEVWRVQGCARDRLDDASAKTLTDLDAALNAVWINPAK